MSASWKVTQFPLEKPKGKNYPPPFNPGNYDKSVWAKLMISATPTRMLSPEGHKVGRGSRRGPNWAALGSDLCPAPWSPLVSAHWGFSPIFSWILLRYVIYIQNSPFLYNRHGLLWVTLRPPDLIMVLWVSNVRTTLRGGWLLSPWQMPGEWCLLAMVTLFCLQSPFQIPNNQVG